MPIENKIIYFNPNSPHGDSSKQMPNKVEPFKTPFDVVPKQTLLSNKHLLWTFLLGLAQSLLMMLMANVKFVPFGDT